MKVLVLYYSQSGDTEKLVRAFLTPLSAWGSDIAWANIQPAIAYPCPWDVYRFFDVFPDCLNGETPEILPLPFEPQQKFDLVVIAYQVWFLAPSLPIQAFLKSKYAQVIADTKVITLITCHTMWNSASEFVKRTIIELKGQLVGHVVVTHQGSPLAHFITAPRFVLTGKKDRLWGLFPPAGFAEADLEFMTQLGERLAQHFGDLKLKEVENIFEGFQTAKANKRYILPELVGITLYRLWAKFIRLGGPSGSPIRTALVFVFALQLIVALPLVLLVCAIVRLLFYPVLNPVLESYAKRMETIQGTS